MRLGSKWIVAPAAGLVLLIGGIGAVSAMNNSDRSADARTTATTITDDRGTRSGQDSASDLNADRGTRSGQDSASDLNDDRGNLSGRDGGQVSGTGFERARAAALRVFPGAAVREVEHAGAASGATYHVELTQPDGTQVEVDLNANFQTVKVERSGRDG
jgi:uncharacterized membrane protein YkoI